MVWKFINSYSIRLVWKINWSHQWLSVDIMTRLWSVAASKCTMVHFDINLSGCQMVIKLIKASEFLSSLHHLFFTKSSGVNFRKEDIIWVTPITNTTDYGHPERAFFQILELLGLGRQIGLKFYEAFGVFLAKL